MDLQNALVDFYEVSEKPKILEIKTPRLLNDKILLSYFDFIS
jgi:2-succinyl-5-enolpyruvyl-6-hydroxy-3-cyclohexene-1-carboxylate synthase